MDASLIGKDGCVTWTHSEGRKGAWMQTYSGGMFFPLDPRPEEIDEYDLAHALSQMCRYGGHSRHFYSVAQHSVLVARKAPAELRLWALLHDSPEAYVADIVRPAKGALQPAYGSLEVSIMGAIAKHFGLEGNEPPAAVMELDNLILFDEGEALLHPHPIGGRWWEAYAPGLGIKIEPWPPAEAEQVFLIMLRQELAKRAN